MKIIHGFRLRSFQESACRSGTRFADMKNSERCFVERFSGGEAIRLGGSGFEIALARSDKSIQVPIDKSILDVLLDEGVDVAFSCMDGVCGSCKVGVLDGLPDHHDSVLGPDEHAANTAMMVCCSGSLTERLVLDL